MADAPVKRDYVDSPMSIRQYVGAIFRSEFADRVQNAERDIRHRVKAESVLLHRIRYVEGVPVRERVHTYRLKTVSVSPQNTVHSYPVTLLVNSLDLDTKFRVRCGTEFKYNGDKKEAAARRRCLDFLFRFENLYKRIGILFGRDMTNHQAAVQTNPHNSVGCCKHIFSALKLLIESGFFRQGYNPAAEKEFLKLFK